jgi:hypothetical protein
MLTKASVLLPILYTGPKTGRSGRLNYSSAPSVKTRRIQEPAHAVSQCGERPMTSTNDHFQ